LVDEDDARLMAARFLEQLADTRRTDARIHLDEVGSAGGDELHTCFAGYRSCEQRLARSRRTDVEDAAGNAAADFGEALRLLQEVDDFTDLILRLVYAGDIRERYLHELRIDRARLLECRHAAGHRAEERETREGQ